MRYSRTALFVGVLGLAFAPCMSAAHADAPGPGRHGGSGTVFSLDPKTGTEKVLHTFVRKGGTDGYSPLSGLTPVGNALVGTTELGGAHRAGIVFSVDRSTGAETILHTFVGGTDGISPDAGLTKFGGLLYGTTQAGGGESCGGSGCGTVYSIDPAGAETLIYSFRFDGKDGNSPEAGLTGYGGKLYGTTLGGGSACCGTVFAVDPTTGAETVLHSFASGDDGAWPYAGLVNVAGTLYGTTCCGGGAAYGGTVFAIDPATGAETVVYSFQPATGDGPYAGLIAKGGLLYGTTCENGAGGAGTVFSLDPASGKETVLHAFRYSDGTCPGGLIDVAGIFYGTTAYGGPDNRGTVFSITTSSAWTMLHAFNKKDGANPAGNLRYVGGKLYGTTAEGGRAK